MSTLTDITRLLDRELQEDFDDPSNNGLQVANSGRVRKIITGVDATLPFFEQAAARGADLVICHHGISWGDLKFITGLNYQRLQFLIQHDMALYASHLPLDAHPRLGNNACLARALRLQQVKPWGAYHGQLIGRRGNLPRTMSLDRFARQVEKILGNPVQVMPYGSATVRSVGMVVGGGSCGLDQAAADGIDVYLSGEPGLVAHNLAQETGINAVYAGHYASESLGVQAVGRWLKKRLRLPIEHIDAQTPY